MYFQDIVIGCIYYVIVVDVEGVVYLVFIGFVVQVIERRSWYEVDGWCSFVKDRDNLCVLVEIVIVVCLLLVVVKVLVKVFVGKWIIVGFCFVIILVDVGKVIWVVQDKYGFFVIFCIVVWIMVYDERIVYVIVLVLVYYLLGMVDFVVFFVSRFKDFIF